MTKESAPQRDRIHEFALEFIRWLCFGAGITILVIVLLFPHKFNFDWRDWREIALNIGLIMLPAFASAILSMAKLFWILLIPGVWFVVVGFSFRLEAYPSRWSAVFLVAALILFISPFLAWALRPKQVNGPKP